MGATSYSKVSKNPPAHHCSQNSVDIIKSLQSMTDLQFGFTATVFETCRNTKKVKPKITVKKCKTNMKHIPHQLATVEMFQFGNRSLCLTFRCGVQVQGCAQARDHLPTTLKEPTVRVEWSKVAHSHR